MAVPPTTLVPEQAKKLPVEVLVRCAPDELELAVNEDIRAFDDWFRELGNDPLTKSEVAAIKTYLWYKTVKGSGDAQAGG
jgi:hypothetical protein